MEIYIVSISSALLGYFSSRVANKKSKGFLPTFGILCILAITATGLTFAGSWISTPAVKQREQDKVEGQWLETYYEGRTKIYAIAVIKYDSAAKYMGFNGFAYDKNGEVLGHWTTTLARHHGEDLEYLYQGQSYNRKNPADKLPRREGLGHVSFSENGKHGKGYFFSVGEDEVLREFELHKILDRDAIEESRDDPKTLIQKLHEDPSYFMKVISAKTRNP